MGMFTPLAFFAETAVAVLNCDTLALSYEQPWSYINCLESSNSSVSMTYSFITQSVPTILVSRNPIIIGNFGYFLGNQSPTSAWKRLDLTNYTTTTSVIPALPVLNSPRTGNFAWPFYDGVDKIVFPPYNDYRWYIWDINTSATTIAFTHSERVNSQYNQRFSNYPTYPRRNDKFYAFPLGNNTAGEAYQSYIYSYDPATNLVATCSAMGNSQSGNGGWSASYAGAPHFQGGQHFLIGDDGLLFTSDGNRRSVTSGVGPGYKWMYTLDMDQDALMTHSQSIPMRDFTNVDEFLCPTIYSATMSLGFSASTTQIQACFIWATSSTTTKFFNFRTARNIQVSMATRAFIRIAERLPNNRHFIIQTGYSQVYIYDALTDTYEFLCTGSVNSGGMFWFNNKLHIQLSTTQWRIYTFNFTQNWNATRYEKTNRNNG